MKKITPWSMFSDYTRKSRQRFLEALFTLLTGLTDDKSLFL